MSNPFSILMVSAVTAFESATYVIERLSARSMTFPKKEMVSLSASTSEMSPLCAFARRSIPFSSADSWKQ